MCSLCHLRVPLAYRINYCAHTALHIWLGYHELIGTQCLDMPATTTSGADATPNGTAKSRDHNQGNQDKKYTVEQKAAVIRVRRCSATAFYEILGLEKTSSDAEVKKAYRKLSLLTHPDKNGYEGADEAFKCE